MIFNWKCNYGIFISLHYFFTYHLPVQFQVYSIVVNGTLPIYFSCRSVPKYLILIHNMSQSFERQRISCQWNLKPSGTNILHFLGSGHQYGNVRVWAGTPRKVSEGVWTASEQFQILLRLSSWEPSVILLLTLILVGKNKTKHLVF